MSQQSALSSKQPVCPRSGVASSFSNDWRKTRFSEGSWINDVWLDSGYFEDRTSPNVAFLNFLFCNDRDKIVIFLCDEEYCCDEIVRLLCYTRSCYDRRLGSGVDPIEGSQSDCIYTEVEA